MFKKRITEREARFCCFQILIFWKNMLCGTRYLGTDKNNKVHTFYFGYSCITVHILPPMFLIMCFRNLKKWIMSYSIEIIQKHKYKLLTNKLRIENHEFKLDWEFSISAFKHLSLLLCIFENVKPSNIVTNVRTSSHLYKMQETDLFKALLMKSWKVH